MAATEEFIRNEWLASDGANGVTNWASFIGRGPPRYTLTYAPKMASPEYAMILLNTTNYKINEQLIPRLERVCLETFPDVKPTVRKLLNGPPVKDPWCPVEAFPSFPAV